MRVVLTQMRNNGSSSHLRTPTWNTSAASPTPAPLAPGYSAALASAQGRYALHHDRFGRSVLVLEDLNGDGRRDDGEPGLPGVRVSNGRDVVETDSKGGYELEARAKASLCGLGFRPEELEAPFARLIEKNSLAAYRHDGFFMCMDTFKEYQQLQSLYERGVAPWTVWRQWSWRATAGNR